MPRQVIIENPILNSPFEEPKRHFRFDKDGITDEVVESRRISGYFVPVPPPKKRTRQTGIIDTGWNENRFEPTAAVNQIRAAVAKWRRQGRPELTKTTRLLLDHWTSPSRATRRLFFCQIEAAETAIYLAEAAGKCGEAWIENELRRDNESHNPGLYRVALKMATGSGKTVVMAMLIAWQSLNKLATPQDARFSDAFLIVTPGITIRDRLRVLYPNDPENYYVKFDLLPSSMREDLNRAKVVITNFHQLMCRERLPSSKLTKEILNPQGESPFKETPAQMVRRVCRELGNKKGIVVLNDEGHHCYRSKSEEQAVRLEADERTEAKKRNEAARVWLTGLGSIAKKVGIKAVYDLSATPFFLRGSGYGEGMLFPWVVSDFSLIDAIEAGIVKVPRVPVADDSMTGDMPTYRDIWSRIREHLPRKGRGTDKVTGEPRLPIELEGALQSLYSNYEKSYDMWARDKDAQARGSTPPVFIVVCNNTNVSKVVFDYIAGWEKELPDGSRVLVPGKLSVFNNVGDGAWTARPNTILIDSEELESGEALSPAFKKIAAAEIEEFKQEYRERFPGANVDELTDADILREVCNTVGKPGKLGEHVKCVVSVSMLTEGWDANTVTHILGVRAFGTQLLCEQVIGRGLRRRSYPDEADKYQPEYAEVYGVPFQFIPCSGSQKEPEPGPTPTRVWAMPERIACMISFPRVTGYRYDLPSEVVTARFTDDSRLVLSTQDVPTKTENAPIVGETTIHTLDDLKHRRPQEVAFLLAKLTLERYFRQDGERSEDKPKAHKFDAEVKHWLFPSLLDVCKQWLNECVVCKDNTFPQLLLLLEHAYRAADKVYQSIVRSEAGHKRLMPILHPYDTIGTTEHVDFDTTRPVYGTRPDKCHISHVVADTGSWEQKTAQALEDMTEVVAYVKNHNVGFVIPYTLAGEEKPYYPDFIVRVDDGHGPDDLLSLIIEVTGQEREDKEAKVATARDMWVPAINNHGGFGRWAFVEVRDPWDAQKDIRANLKELGFVG